MDISKLNDVKELESMGYQAMKRRMAYMANADQETQNIIAIDKRINEILAKDSEAKPEEQPNKEKAKDGEAKR